MQVLAEIESFVLDRKVRPTSKGWPTYGKDDHQMRTVSWIGIEEGTRAGGSRATRCALAFVLTLAACGGNGQPASSPANDGASIVGQEAPDAEFAALQGSGKIKLSSLRGKVVLLDFWASWCAPCQEELPLLDDMAARLKDKDIQIVGLSLDENKADAQRFLGQKSSWSLTLGHDPDQSVADQFKPPKMPTSYVIDRKGVVRQINAGFERADAKKIEAQLLDLASAG